MQQRPLRRVPVRREANHADQALQTALDALGGMPYAAEFNISLETCLSHIAE